MTIATISYFVYPLNSTFLSEGIIYFHRISLNLKVLQFLMQAVVAYNIEYSVRST